MAKKKKTRGKFYEKKTVPKEKGTVNATSNKNIAIPENIPDEEKIIFNKNSHSHNNLNVQEFDYQNEEIYKYSQEHKPKYGKQRLKPEMNFGGKWKATGMVAGAVALGGLALNAASNRGQLSNAQLYGQRPLY